MTISVRNHLVVTRALPGLEEAIAELPAGWTTTTMSDGNTLNQTEFAELMKDATAVIVVGHRVDESVLSSAEKLRVISNYGVGVDNIDLEAARARRVIVTNLPNEVTYSTAELTIALMLACSRQIVKADRYVRKHNPWSPVLQTGWNLYGKTLGVVGFGRIGQRVAQMAKAFEMSVVYYARSRNVNAERLTGAAYRDLHALLAESDIVSLHVPATPHTRHLIDQDALARMKSGAILINTARGAVVDEEALVSALRSGTIRSAGLDVYENEPEVDKGLIELDNVVLTPHIGTSALETRIAMTAQAVKNVLIAHRGGEPNYRVV